MSSISQRCVLIVCLSFVLMVLAPRGAAAELVYGLTDTNRLVVFSPSAPGTIVAEMAITGLQPGEVMRAIDFRPRDWQLYGYGSTHRLYHIHMLTGVATAIGPGPLGVRVDDTAAFGFDFNPGTDQIRVITSTNQNFRIDPSTGTAIDGDPLTVGVQGDTPLSPAGAYVAAAHTHNAAGTPMTTLVGIDATTDRLVRIGGAGGTPSPDLGAVADIGPLAVDTNAMAALDATLTPVNALYAWLSDGGFCRVNLNTGAVTPIGSIPIVGDINDIAVLNPPAVFHVLTEDGHLLRLKGPPLTVLGDVLITGLVDQASGELLLAIDVRPATGQLYGVSNRARVYTIDPATGASSVVVGPGTNIGPIEGRHFGLDFNPLTDEMRVVSDEGTNLRVHPNTLLVKRGADLTVTGIAAVAYDQHLTGAGLTTLYGIETADNELGRVGGMGGTPSPDLGEYDQIDDLFVDVDLRTGFDMAPTDDTAFLVTRIGGDDRLYHIDPVTAIGSLLGPIANTAGPVVGLAIAPAGRVEFSSSVQPVHESAASVTLTINRVGSSHGPISVDYRTTGGTATEQADYQPLAGTLTLLDGETTGTVVLRIKDDSLQEERETIEVTLSDPTLGARLGATSMITVRITDNDAPANPPPIITVTNPTTDPGVTAHSLLFTIGGTASDNTAIPSIEWINDRGGRGGRAQHQMLPSTQWLVEDIRLELGENIITVTATDTEGAQSTDTVTVTLAEVSYLLAEGATGSFFDLDILLANPHLTPAPVTVRFLQEGGQTTVRTLTLPATSRTTLRVDEIPGLEDVSVSTVVISDSGLPLIVERTMRWDANGYGAHTEKAVDAPAPLWYFAEGSQGFFATYILLTNPSSTDSEATIEFLREGTTRHTFTVPALSRFNVAPGPATGGLVPELVNEEFSAVITSTQPIVVERAMYLDAGGVVWSAGTNALATRLPESPLVP